MNPEVVTGSALVVSTLTNVVGAHLRENHRQEEIASNYYSDPVIEQGVPLALNGILAGFLGGTIEAALSRDIEAGIAIALIGMASILITEPTYRIGRSVVQRIRNR